MALIKSSIVSEISGSIGGVTFARNAGGAYARGRVKGTNVASPARARVRSIMANLTERWRTELTPLQREGWNNFAEQTSWTNRLGDSIRISGLAAYVSGNSLLLMATQPPVDAAPVIYSQGPGIVDTGGVSILDDGSFEGGPFELTGYSGNGFIVLQMSNPQVATRLSSAGIPVRQIGAPNPVSGTGFLAITSGSTAAINSEITGLTAADVGRRVFFRARAVTSDGRAGPEARFDVIIDAA